MGCGGVREWEIAGGRNRAGVWQIVTGFSRDVQAKSFDAAPVFWGSFDEEAQKACRMASVKNLMRRVTVIS